MIKEEIPFSADGEVKLTAYLHEASDEMPFWKKRPAVLLLPGGGFAFLSDREQDPAAFSFFAKGFHVFVLRYSIREQAVFPQPVIEASKALAMIRERKDEWGVIEDHIAVCGFSAGGHVAASLGTMWHRPFLQKKSGCCQGENKPNALVLLYPLLKKGKHIHKQMFQHVAANMPEREAVQTLSLDRHVDQNTPPAFLFHTYTDELIPVEHSLDFASALSKADVPFELHVYPSGRHGLAMGTEATSNGAAGNVDEDAAAWFDLSVKWLRNLFGSPLHDAKLKIDEEWVRAKDEKGHPLAQPQTLSYEPPERLQQTGHFTLDTRLRDILANEEARAAVTSILPAYENHMNEHQDMSLRNMLAAEGALLDEALLDKLQKRLWLLK